MPRLLGRWLVATFCYLFVATAQVQHAGRRLVDTGYDLPLDTASIDNTGGQMEEEDDDRGASGGKNLRNKSAGDGGCGEYCIHYFLTAPVLLLLLLWLMSTPWTIPDWKRQRKYVEGLEKAMQLQPTPCPLEDLPPSGTWPWQCPELSQGVYMLGSKTRNSSGMTFRELDLTFATDGTFAGEVMPSPGDFIIQNGRFNVATGQFAWEEVQVDDMSEGSAYLRNFGMALLLGPHTLCAPLAFQKGPDGQRLLSAPRTVVEAVGIKNVEGSWTLQGTSITYDRQNRLVVGSGSNLESRAVEVSSPVASPIGSPRRILPHASVRAKRGQGVSLDDVAMRLATVGEGEDVSSPLVSPCGSPTRRAKSTKSNIPLSTKLGAMWEKPSD